MSSAALRVMVTGHRELAQPALVADRIRTVFERLGATEAVSGGAAGADRVFAEVAVEMGVPLHLMLPNRWYRDKYPNVVSNEVLAAAAQVTYVVDRPEAADWRSRWTAERWWQDNFARNVAMVGASEAAVVVSPRHPLALLEERSGGTAHCVKALRRARPLSRVIWVPDIPSAQITWVPLTRPAV